MDVLKDKLVKTRKLHRCWGCSREMRPGSMMKHFTTVDAGEFLSAYFCAVCDEYMSISDFRSDDVIGEGELKENDPVGWWAVQSMVEQRGGEE